MLSQAESYTPALEKYLLAANKTEYFESLKPDSKQSQFISLLIDPWEEEQSMRKRLHQLGYPEHLYHEVLQFKTVRDLQNPASEKETQKILKSVMDAGKFDQQFTHSKPIDIMHSGQEVLENEGPSEASFHQTVKEVLMAELGKGPHTFNSFSDYGVKCLSQGTLNTLDLNQRANFLSRKDILSSYSDGYIAGFIKQYYTEKVQLNVSYKLQPSIYSNLSISQNAQLMEVLPHLSRDVAFLSFWFKQKYIQKLERFGKNTLLSISEKEEKRKLLLEILKSLKKIDNLTVKSFERQTFMELMILDLSLENPTKELFKQFLQEMYIPCSNLSEHYRNEVNFRYQKNPDAGTQWYRIHNFEVVQWDQNKIIQEYITSLVKKEEKYNDFIKTFSKYLDLSMLEKNCARVRLNKGETVENLHTILSNAEVNLIKQKKKISILTKNKKHFKVDEEVVLSIRVKNVKTIKVKIYELNLQKNYLEKMTKIDENMNLTFLEPTMSFSYDVDNENPLKQNIYDLPIKQIGKKRAVYIVDLRGDGISSRAVIRKGAIVCLTKTTLAGQQLKFYNEEGKRIDQLELWIKGKKEKVKQSYTIPFGKTRTDFKLIAVKDDFAELIDVAVENEEYNWNIGYIYNAESFIVGNKAKVVIHPRLKLQNQYIGLKLLKNSKVAVEMVNSQNIKSYLTFDNIEWSSSQDYVLEFPVQSYLQRITITLTAQINLYSGTKKTMTDSKVIYIDLGEGTTGFADFYLKKVDQKYELRVLGMNGEPIPRVDVILTVEQLGLSLNEQKKVKTDSEGTIRLGKMPTIASLIANGSGSFGSFTKSWRLNDKLNEVCYSSAIFYKQGQHISLPIASGLKSQDFIIQRRGEGDLVYVDISEAVVLDHQRLHLKDLPTGEYQIYILPSDRKIKLNVLQGSQWEAANQVYDSHDGLVYQIKRSANQLTSLGQAHFEHKQNQTSVKIKLNLPESGLSEQLRAHIIASNFFPPNSDGVFDPLQFIDQKLPIVQKFSLKQCEYFNNKTLSDEASYVQNRQEQKKFIGNNLQKPHIFLKRIEVRETNQKDEQLRYEGNYLKADSQLSRNRQNQRCAMLGSRLATQRLFPNNLATHNNFLVLPAYAVSNGKGEELSFQVPKGYSHFTVYLISHESAIQRNYSLNNKQPSINKDLRHAGLIDQQENKGWTMSRESYSLKVNDKMKISRDSHWATVSLSNIADFAELRGCKVPEWVVNWSRFSPEKKREVYGKQLCHQLNTYIKLNDRQFFSTVVGPHIRNKVIKTFVDYCLLDDQKCEEYARIQYLERLNEFEKVLLVKYLAEHGKGERAQQIAKSMELRQKMQKVGFEEFKQSFDTVINARKPEEPPGMEEFKQRQIINKMSGRMQGLEGYGGYGGAMRMDILQRCEQLEPMEMHQMNQMSWGMDQMSNMSYAPPPPPVNQLMYGGWNELQNTRSAKVATSRAMEMDCLMDTQEERNLEARGKYKAGFQQVQKTKQYTETTYDQIKNPDQSMNLVPPSLFWSELAVHLSQKPTEPFLSNSFMHLSSKRDFTLALCFVPNNANADFDIKNQAENIQISARSPFLIFVKEVRPTDFTKKFGVMINQRFFDPMDQYVYEQDGTAIQKQVEEFIVRKPYTFQTVVTNTSGTPLELQMLLDIPEGAIPLQSHQYTQILSTSLGAYSTTSFTRNFYFPKQGRFSFYPSNACRGKQIIAKANRSPPIEVKTYLAARKMESFSDVIHSGNQQQILDFLAKKNIFDYNIFQADSILWMLKDRKVYERVIEILSKRCYYDQQIWTYAVFHKDTDRIKETMISVLASDVSSYPKTPIFEYFPYYSSRTHKFANESKSTIRNVQFKQTYNKFVYLCVAKKQFESTQKIAFLYYLLLQDRIDEASQCYKLMSEAERKAHKLQSDYFECFLDMYQGYPEFKIARKISAEYIEYPVPAWKNLFKEIFQILKEYDSATYVEEQKDTIQSITAVVNEGTHLKISIPAETKVEVYFFPINLELYYSEFAFSEFKEFSAIKPHKSTTFGAEKGSRDEKVIRPEELKDVVVEIYESKEGKPAKKIQSINWTHPEFRIKINENKGTAQVFFKGKQLAGCYCKVYSEGEAGKKFYRDGYTDISGTFKYVLADVEKITSFNIIFVTEFGGVTMNAAPPSTTGFIQ